MQTPEYKPWYLIDYKQTKPVQTEWFFQEFLKLTNTANLQEYELYAKLIESLPLQDENSIDKTNNIWWYIRILDEYISFKNLSQLRWLLLDAIEKNWDKEFEVVFNHNWLKINHRIFFTKVCKWKIVVDYKRYSLWILFDTNFWIEKNKDPKLMAFYETIKANRSWLDILKELWLYVIKMERNWNYWKAQEDDILKHFQQSMKLINSYYWWYIEQITKFSLHYFKWLYEFFNWLKQENVKEDLETLLNNPGIYEWNDYLPSDFIKENINFFKKLFDEIPLIENEEKNKTPMLWDWLIVHYSIMKNIYSHPSKCLLISEDKDINTISKIFVELIIPRFVWLNVFAFFQKYFQWSYEDSIKQDWLTTEDMIDIFFKTIKEIVEIIDFSKPKNPLMNQVLSTYKPSSRTVVNYYISSILFDALLWKPESMLFLGNMCSMSSRLWLSAKEIIKNKTLLWLSQVFFNEKKIISLTKSQLQNILKGSREIKKAELEEEKRIKKLKKAKRKQTNLTKRKQRKK